ncbi:MAG: sulfite exporter TauE/SafE family protein [Candidatus Bathyarchaeia archaeon]
MKNYIPTLILLLIIVGLMVAALLSGSWMGRGAPQVTILDGFLLAIVGFVAGLLGGLIGTGGCSVMLPILHFWMSYSAPLSIGTTLFAVIFTTISGSYGHLIRKNLDKNAAIWIGGLGTSGVILGSWLFTILVKHVSLLNLILGLAFIWPSLRMITEGSGIAKSKAEQRDEKTIPGSRLGMGAFGFVIGILTGIVGLGGGYALVPGLIIYLTRRSMLRWGLLWPP